MKITKNILFLIFMWGQLLSGIAQWRISTLPTPSSEGLTGIAYVDSNTIAVSGYLYDFHLSKDGGKTWFTPTPNWGVTCTEVQFVSPDTGFLACSEILLYTTNGGMTWNNLFVGHASQPINDFHFFSTYLGYMSMAPSYPKKVINDTVIDLDDTIVNSSGVSISTSRHIQFANKEIGYLLGTTAQFPGKGNNSNILWRTRDGGSTWDTIGQFFTSIYVVDTAVIYAIWYNEKLYKSTNGGDTWAYIPTPFEPIWGFSAYPGPTTEQLYFINRDTGFVARFDHTYRTRDGGQTWEEMVIEGLDSLSQGPVAQHGHQYEVHCFDENHCAITGTIMVDSLPYPAVYITDNGGGEGRPVSLSNTKAIYKESLIMYPNPAFSNIRIAGMEGYGNALLTVSNMMGQIVHQQRILEYPVNLSVSSWPSGVYRVSVQQSDRPVVTGTFIVR